MTNKEIDALDIKILQLLQKDNMLSAKAISEKIGLSLPAVAKRIQKLNKEKVITGNTVILDAEKLGYGISILTLVAVESEEINLLDGMKKRFVDCPNIQSCYYITGEYDFAILFIVKSIKEYEALTSSLFFKTGNVKSFKTNIIMNIVKNATGVPLG